jgi:carbamoyl-phosphate synthase/aspartate carbamoyltransferase/dihydroorotase
MAVLRLPGLIDCHVHLREPGGSHKEDFSTGSAAALAGGITTVLAMPNTSPPLVDSDSLALAEEAGRLRSRCDYGLYAAATSENARTVCNLADRTIGLKFYLDATFGPLRIQGISVLRDHMSRWQSCMPMVFHAEVYSLATVLMLAFLENCPVHIAHVSRREEIELIRDAKERGVKVTCEVCPHHLFLSTEDIHRLGPGWCEVRPPLASPNDCAALWKHIDIVDCIATDHAPHTIPEKSSANPPPGFPGLETVLSLMFSAIHNGQITLEGLVKRMYDNPRRIFGLPEQPDTWIEVDTEETWVVRGSEMQSRSGWSPFEGRELRSRVKRVMLRGNLAYENGVVFAKPGTGQNVKGKPNSSGNDSRESSIFGLPGGGKGQVEAE